MTFGADIIAPDGWCIGVVAKIGASRSHFYGFDAFSIAGHYRRSQGKADAQQAPALNLSKLKRQARHLR